MAMRHCPTCGGRADWSRAWCSFSCAAAQLPLPFPEHGGGYPGDVRATCIPCRVALQYTQ